MMEAKRSCHSDEFFPQSAPTFWSEGEQRLNRELDNNSKNSIYG